MIMNRKRLKNEIKKAARQLSEMASNADSIANELDKNGESMIKICSLLGNNLIINAIIKIEKRNIEEL